MRDLNILGKVVVGAVLAFILSSVGLIIVKGLIRLGELLN